MKIEEGFPKYVAVNDTDLLLAIREGMHPMTEWYDRKHHDLPYFWNYVTGPKYGNSHHPSYSCVHTVGRWLDALVNAEEITAKKVPEEIYEKLSYWVSAVFENETGMMGNLDPESFRWEKTCDLHNLREAMYGFAALLKRNPDDAKAKQGAEHLIDMVDRYTDFETGEWKCGLYEEECGGKVECGASSKQEIYRFSSTLGRYIGGLVRLYQVFPLGKALEQAVRLTQTAFRVVLGEDGGFSADRFAKHFHSTSSMISGIAMLGALIRDHAILERVRRFMENGYYEMALDFRWCLENDAREDDMVGEINNTGDFLEACLCLGDAGYGEYYDRADRMIRCHLLPAQLLDVSFLSDEASDDDAVHKMASRMKGAFGFPCPYGHEYAPGSDISFNWDIVGGGVSSLCQAYRRVVSEVNGILSVNMQFSCEDEKIRYRDPYPDGVMELLLKKDMGVRVCLPLSVEWELLEEELERQEITFFRYGNWLYLYGLYGKGNCSIPVRFQTERKAYRFRCNSVTVEFCGNRITGMSSKGKRLCFFKEIEEND